MVPALAFGRLPKTANPGHTSGDMIIVRDPVAAEVLQWVTTRGVPALTVVVKLTFELRPNAYGKVVHPLPLFDDEYTGVGPHAGLRFASDRAPYKPQADVLLAGSIFATGLAPCTHRIARLAVFGPQGALVDRVIQAAGARTLALGTLVGPAQFDEIPVQFEDALGHPWNNPVGCDPEGPALPRLVDCADPEGMPGALGPVPPTWWWRQISTWNRFNAALPPQRTQTLEGHPTYLRGDEAIYLEGFHPSLDPCTCWLPAAQPRLYMLWPEHGIDTEVQLLADTLWLEPGALRGTLTWRSALLVDPVAIERISQLQFAVALTRHGRAPEWPLAPYVKAPGLEPPLAAIGAEELGAPPAAEGFHPCVVARAAPALEAELTHRDPVVRVRIAESEEVGIPPVIAAGEPTARDPGSEQDALNSAAQDTLPQDFPHGPTVQAVSQAPKPRVTENVPIRNTSPLVVFTRGWRLRAARDGLVVVVKGTYQLVKDGPAALADEQDPPTGDLPHDANPGASLRYGSDFALFKPKADLLLSGHAYPAARLGSTAEVGFRLGDHLRQLSVFGDRTVSALGAESAPRLFERMPLRWERAFGGPGYARNPVGIGHSASGLLPNLVPPPGTGTALPACFAPIPPEWEPRRGLIGKYDASWLKHRWPYFPDSFDWAWFNASPPDLQIPYVEQAVDYCITGVRPEGEVLTGQLPTDWPRVFLQQTIEAGGAFQEILLRLDTLWFDTDAQKLVLIWRGMLEVSDEEATEISTLFVTTDPRAQPSSAEAMEQRFQLQEALETLGVLEETAEEANDNREVAHSDPAVAKALAAGRTRRLQLIAAGLLPPLGDETIPEITPLARDEVMLRLAQGVSLAGMDLTGCDLSGLNLSGRDLKGTLLTRANLANAILDGAQLEDAVLVEAQAQSASFAEANLAQTALDGASLTRANFRAATLTEATFNGANLDHSNFILASAERASFTESSLIGADLSQARLTGAELTACLLEDASFCAADLTDARFYDAVGSRVDFSTATMANARADGANLPDAQFTEIDGHGSVWEGANLARAQFLKANLMEANFLRTNLDQANLGKIDGREACFRKAKLAKATFIRANLMHATFEGADLKAADLRGANLYQAELWKASLTGARLDAALVEGTKLKS